MEFLKSSTLRSGGFLSSNREGEAGGMPEVGVVAGVSIDEVGLQ